MVGATTRCIKCKNEFYVNGEMEGDYECGTCAVDYDYIQGTTHTFSNKESYYNDQMFGNWHTCLVCNSKEVAKDWNDSTFYCPACNTYHEECASRNCNTMIVSGKGSYFCEKHADDIVMNRCVECGGYRQLEHITEDSPYCESCT